MNQYADMMMVGMIAAVSCVCGHEENGGTASSVKTVSPDVAAVKTVLQAIPEKNMRAYPIRILDDRKMLLHSEDFLTEYLVTVEDGALSVEEYRKKEVSRGRRGTESLQNGVWVWKDETGEEPVRRYRVPAAVKADFLQLWQQKIRKDLNVPANRAFGIHLVGKDEINLGIQSTQSDGSTVTYSCVCQYVNGKWKVSIVAC